MKPVAWERFLKNQEQASRVRLPCAFGDTMCAACVLQHTTEPGASHSAAYSSTSGPFFGCIISMSGCSTACSKMLGDQCAMVPRIAPMGVNSIYRSFKYSVVLV